MPEQHDDRGFAVAAAIDRLASDYADVLASEDQDEMVVCVGAVLLTAWTDPTCDEGRVWVSRTDSATTGLLAGIGIIGFAHARAVE